MAERNKLTTEEKALKINLNSELYGSFAEIGAGQEVAANFFKAGGSSGTIAYTHSAYDMKVSDTLYGACKRYVCEERLLMMLNKEYEDLVNTLPERAENTKFFAFANTVESLNYHKTNQGQGWVGIRFQLNPQTEPNDIILHVKMHDIGHKAQQEALGILGVNLVHAAYYCNEDLDLFLTNLSQRLPRDRVEIDMLRISGPDFSEVDNRLIALRLVRRGMTDATMFDPAGNVLQPPTALYKNNILLMRGRFRPVTKVHIDMVNRGQELFMKEEDVDPKRTTVLFELTLKDLTADGKISESDFVDRAELLGSLGYTVMISNYLKYYKMVEYLAGIARGRKIGVILGVYNLQTVFDENYYTNLPGGLLEAFGRGFGHNVKLFTYPAIEAETGEVLTMDDLVIPEHLRGLMDYMIKSNKLVSIDEFDESTLHIFSDDVLARIRSGASNWEEDVPDTVAKAIKFYHLFGYKKEEEKVTAFSES